MICKCRSCKHKFEGEYWNDDCPECGSEDVEEARSWCPICDGFDLFCEWDDSESGIRKDD